MKRRWLSILLVLLLLVSNTAFASNSRGNDTPWGQFKDLEKDFWALPAIQKMLENGILKGFEDNTFRPNALVTRAEFAKIMVLALNLEVPKVKDSEFVDVPDKFWALPFIEAARDYLTGYQSSNGIKFKPNQAAVREDMAVALVMALKLPLTNVDALNGYADAEQISAELKPYVATAISSGIMKGSEKDGKKFFAPQGELTRAEAAQLIANVLTGIEKKILLPKDGKVILPPAATGAVKLQAKAGTDAVELNWIGEINEDQFKYFKVVASLSDATPQYPDNGYVAALGDDDTRRFRIKLGMGNNGGDFAKFEAGKTYYVAVTTVYENGKSATSNVVQITMPGVAQPPVEKKAAVLVANVIGGKVILNWQGNVAQDQLQYFKVVASIADATPQYPDNGYAAVISEAAVSSLEITNGISYTGTEFAKFETGKAYYFAITTVYKDGTKLTSNVVQVTLP